VPAQNLILRVSVALMTSLVFDRGD